MATKKVKPAPQAKSDVFDFGSDGAEIASLIDGTHANPFAFLGLHKGHSPKGLTARCFMPGAQSVSLVASVGTKSVWPLTKLHAEGLFAARIEDRDEPLPIGSRRLGMMGPFYWTTLIVLAHSSPTRKFCAFAKGICGRYGTA
jgi:hypothetical protein